LQCEDIVAGGSWLSAGCFACFVGQEYTEDECEEFQRETTARMAWFILWCWMGSAGGLGEAVVKSPLGVVVHCQGQWKASVAGWGAIVMEIWIGTSSGC